MLWDAYDLSFYEFDDEKDLQSYGVLLCDVVHGKPPLKPLYMGLGWYWYYHGTRYAAETLYLPTTKGWDSRFINGYPYITCIRTTEEERREREPKFREKIRPFLENFDGVWDPLKMELISTYKEAKKKWGLREWTDIRKLRDVDLLSFFLDFAYVINRKEAETHFIMLIATYYIAGTFQQMWRETFRVEPSIDPEFNRLMAGFESKDTEITRELWKLGQRAKEMGLENVFQIDDDEAVMRELKSSEVGKRWYDSYYEFLLEHGWRCERMHAYDSPCWVEKPALGISRIKILMREDKFPFDVERDRIVKERIRLEEEVVRRVPVAEREVFRLMLKGAQRSGYWSEDHTYYCDLYVGSLGRWIVTEFGRRFAENGTIDDPEDIHFLHPNEIRKAAIPQGRVSLREYVQRRKKRYEENLKIDPKPFYGDITLAQEILRSDPTLSVSTQVPIVREELKADLYGAASAPGVVEGVARVIMVPEQLKELKPGEILVAPGTSTQWTVAFAIIKGLVTDGGSFVSHPVIMSREFGIPCVAGCVEATKKIKTGQRIRVDGDRGVVYILD